MTETCKGTHPLSPFFWAISSKDFTFWESQPQLENAISHSTKLHFKELLGKKQNTQNNLLLTNSIVHQTKQLILLGPIWDVISIVDPSSRPQLPGFSLGKPLGARDGWTGVFVFAGPAVSMNQPRKEFWKFTNSQNIISITYIYIIPTSCRNVLHFVCKFWKESHYKFQTLLLGRLMSLQLPYLFQLWRLPSQSKHTSLWMFCQQQLKRIYVRLSFGYSVADESGKEMEIQPGTLVTCEEHLLNSLGAIRAHFANRANNKCLYFRVLDLYPLRVLDLYPKPAKHHQNLPGCEKKHVGSAASPSEDSISSSWKSASWQINREG